MELKDREFLYRLKESKGYKILKEHIFKEMLNGISKNCSERDIAYHAGRKSVFEFIDDETKKLNFLEQYYPEDENEENNTLCLKMQNLNRKQILILILEMIKILLIKK